MMLGDVEGRLIELALWHRQQADHPIHVAGTSRQQAQVERFHAQAVEDVRAVHHALAALVVAWQALPGGRSYNPRQVERWLADHMHPAVVAARLALGRPAQPLAGSPAEATGQPAPVGPGKAV